MEIIKRFITDLISALQVAKMYSLAHPKFEEAVNRAYQTLHEILEGKNELIIGIIGDELAFESEILFDLSVKLGTVIGYLKGIGAERIVFHQGLEKDELVKFITFLRNPPGQLNISLQDYFLNSGIKNIDVGRIKISRPSLKGEVIKSVNFLKRYEESLDNISLSVNTVLDEKAMDYSTLKGTVVNIMENLAGKYQDFLKLSAIKTHDVSTFIHLLNVSVLSMHFSSKLGFTKEDILEIGISALFHDVGKLYISRQIIQKDSQLTDTEYAVVKNHSSLGAKILLKHKETMGVLPVVVAFEHHLRYDLKGYPKVIYPFPLHTASLIVSICDVYDALTQRRTYKRDYPPNVIYEIMLKEKGGLYDPQLLERFFDIIGVWPIGTIVRLNDTRIAIVRQENEHDRFSPKVEVVSPQHEKELLDLHEQKKQIWIVNFLNPLNEGKEYVSLI